MDNIYFDIIKYTFGTITIGYISHKIINDYKVKKDFKAKKIVEIKKTPKYRLYCNEIIVSNLQRYETRKNIDTFIKFMLKNYSDDILQCFFYNINSIKIKESKIMNFELLGMKVDGYYDACTNEIKVTDSNVIFHELFHASSTIYDGKKGMVYQGFSQVDLKNDTSIGIGLNEGYTEYLSSKYFYHNDNSAYFYESYIAQKLEKIIGFNEMEELYLTADLYGLIEKLKKYNTKEKIMTFINNIDIISKHRFYENDIIKKLKEDVYEFLYNTYLNKLNNDYNNGMINKCDVINNIKNYLGNYSFFEKNDNYILEYLKK